MPGHQVGEASIRTPHHPSVDFGERFDLLDRPAREAEEDRVLAPEATRAVGGGDRERAEEADEWRTCFERDRDRILHSTAFRRLAGKTQVFIFPADHQRTRLTHALEVAQVAAAIARACRLNVALTEAIALGHDCGHGPGGHASEEALSPFLDGGFDHAVWGADVTAAPLNLCVETLDGIRNHSWSRPTPMTPEGEVVAFADRIAYSAHDLEDAVHAGIVTPDELPRVVAERCGRTRSAQLHRFVTDVVLTTRESGKVAMSEALGEALEELRRFNYERIYLRKASRDQSAAVVDLLSTLVEHYATNPEALPAGECHGTDGTDGTDRTGCTDGPDRTGCPGRTDRTDRTGGSGIGPADPAELWRAVGYVSGMTDRFACTQAIELLGWSVDRLPAAVVE